jgi:hypothetical protein
MDFIVKWKSGLKGTRSERDGELRRSGWGGTMTEEQVDKCRFLEKKIKEDTGAAPNNLPQHIVDLVK